MTQYICTDNYEWLKSRPDNSIDSIVTDSPYGLGKEPDAMEVLRDWLDHGYHEVKGGGFMGKSWDSFVPQPILWREALRVLKPGGYLVSFFGTRTYDWGVMAIRLVGFEIRDQIAWVYGSGFPKSANQEGEWEGWGTGLKPAMEPIVLARKPMIGTVAKNLGVFGTGAINIKVSRVPLDGDYKSKPNGRPSLTGLPDHYDTSIANHPDSIGRWPANLIHDGSDEVLEVFPEAQGQLGPSIEDGKDQVNKIYGKMKRGGPHHLPKNETTKSAARFFYCAKASREERNRGLENFPKKPGGPRSNTSGQHITRRDGGDPDPVANFHPTVKPIALMRYLVKLVTPTKGTVLDPFCGSGTTGIAAEIDGFDCVCLDDTQDYIEISEARAKAWRSPLFS